MPVYQLLGGKHRDKVESFASATGPSKAEMFDQARRLVAAGWTCVRVAPSYYHGGTEFDPRRSIAATARDLVELRAALGPEITLGIDYHHRHSPAEAASFCNMLPPGTLDFLEEPIRCESPEAYIMLRKMTQVPFAVGEEFASKWQAAPYLEQGLTQYMRLDVCNIGGFTEAMKIAGWCEKNYIDLMPHNPLGPVCTAASVHMSAAVANLSWQETRQSSVEQLGFHDPHLFPVQVKMEGTYYVVPDKPGLGVEVNEKALRSASPTHVESPHLRRADGSVTNW